MVCAVPFSRFDLFAAVVDKNDVTDQARSIKRGVSRKTEDFFVPAWLPKRPISGRKRDFTGSPRLLFYTSCNQVVIVEVEDPSIDFA